MSRAEAVAAAQRYFDQGGFHAVGRIGERSTEDQFVARNRLQRVFEVRLAQGGAARGVVGGERVEKKVVLGRSVKGDGMDCFTVIRVSRS